MIPTTLVVGASPTAREAAIAAAAGNENGAAMILEGMPDGSALLEHALPQARIVRIAPGCLCCSGNLTMRVTLNRMLRARPARLYIGLASVAHLDRIRAFLNAPPYDNLLTLTKDLQA
ncbi:MAG TPA: GTPase [Noviherbaspirillum sp.]|uniref:GTPase n=1 Tax=Noviherbaspirillum sp. TaxID=1926288 RepID=UPI002D49039D|nr:GTPase [Noviherbaspirillum sp.]HYD95119.1 GTPase [Noviherbaspirillum sp.]